MPETIIGFMPHGTCDLWQTQLIADKAIAKDLREEIARLKRAQEPMP